MILTGRSLDHFNEWYWSVWFDNKERDYYSNKDEAVEAIERTDKIFMHALLIKFFDSVGIYIYAEFFRKNIKGDAKFVSSVTESRKGLQPLGIEFDSRPEATRQAIIKANKIYNEKNN